MPNQSLPSRRRGGTSIASIFAILSLTSILATIAWVARPMYLHADITPTPQTITAANPRHQQIIQLLADLLQNSSNVTAIHPRDPSPYAEVVLRTSGQGQPVTADQIALLSHSRVLQTITLYTLNDPQLTFTHDELPHSDFPNRWRDNPNVHPTLLATSISDMHIEQVHPNQLLIVLTWDANSVDGEDKASLLVNVTTNTQ